MSISKATKELKKLILTKKEQYDFYKGIAFSTDPSVPWNVKLAAFDKLCDLCGTTAENAKKWIISFDLK